MIHTNLTIHQVIHRILLWPPTKWGHTSDRTQFYFWNIFFPFFFSPLTLFLHINTLKHLNHNFSPSPFSSAAPPASSPPPSTFKGKSYHYQLTHPVSLGHAFHHTESIPQWRGDLGLIPNSHLLVPLPHQWGTAEKKRKEMKRAKERRKKERHSPYLIWELCIIPVRSAKDGNFRDKATNIREHVCIKKWSTRRSTRTITHRSKSFSFWISWRD